MKWIDRSDQCHKWKSLGCESLPPFQGAVSTCNRWTVLMFNVPSADDTPWKGMVRMGINYYHANGRSKEITVNWSTIQEIKEDFWPGRLAIEVYPALEQVHNSAPMRWLWILPFGSVLPFSLEGDQVGL